MVNKNQKNFLFYIIFIISTFIILVNIANANTFSGIVINIIDGNNILVQDDQNLNIYKISLYGIDCPNIKQSYGIIAKGFTETITFNKIVIVDTIKSKYLNRNKIYGIVTLPNNKILNEELLKNGYAWSRNKNYKYLEIIAKNNKLGLWKEDNNPNYP